MSNKTTVILSAGRPASNSSGDPTLRALEQDLAAPLENWPEVQLVLVPHLVDLTGDGPAVQYLQSVDGPMIVLSWLYPRAIYWQLGANRIHGRMGQSSFAAETETSPAADRPASDSGRCAPDRTIWCLDLRWSNEPEPFLEEIRRIVKKSAAEVSDTEPAGETIRIEEDTKYRWYPVIDYARCTNCMECLNFCLFGVLGLDESQEILVEQPDACRNGCPACSRVCPSQAIMFPMHHTPVIAGDPTASDDGFNLGLVQLLGTPSPAGMSPGAPVPGDVTAGDRASAERDRALAEKAAAEKAPRDDLDDLVDDLDKMDL